LSSIIFAPGENIILSGKGKIEQPIVASGEAYLTNRRLLIIQKSGLIRKRETPLVDIRIDMISYAKVEGLLSKVLVIGVPQGGSLITYKIKVPHPESWLSQILALKSSIGTKTEFWP